LESPESQIGTAYRSFEGNVAVAIDRTGVGDPIVEDLRNAGVNIPDHPLDLGVHLLILEITCYVTCILLEQDKIKSPMTKN